MVKSTPPDPHRFAQHLPRGIRASTLEEALSALTERYGEPERAPMEGGLVAHSIATEDTHYRIIQGGGALVGIHTAPAAMVQLFIRPCSGRAGALTGTGSATGSVLFAGNLTTIATAGAIANFWALYAATPNICAAPCKTIPLNPMLTSVSVTVVARVFGVPSRITVTVDYTSTLWCV